MTWWSEAQAGLSTCVGWQHHLQNRSYATLRQQAIKDIVKGEAIVCMSKPWWLRYGTNLGVQQQTNRCGQIVSIYYENFSLKKEWNDFACRKMVVTRDDRIKQIRSVSEIERPFIDFMQIHKIMYVHRVFWLPWELRVVATLNLEVVPRTQLRGSRRWASRAQRSASTCLKRNDVSVVLRASALIPVVRDIV